MLFRQVFDYCIQCMVWITVMLALTSLVFNLVGVMQGVVGLNTKIAFDESKDVETIKVSINENSEQMVVAASDIDRKYSSRVKLFDDIFNIPIAVLQQVNNLIQGIITSPGQSIMAASGYGGRSLDIKKEKDTKA